MGQKRGNAQSLPLGYEKFARYYLTNSNTLQNYSKSAFWSVDKLLFSVDKRE